MTSAPLSVHFDDDEDTVPLPGFANLVNVQESIKERDRAGAFVELQSSGESLKDVTSQPAQKSPLKVEHTTCVSCQESEKLVSVTQQLNEELMRGFSRIISRLNQAREVQKMLDEGLHHRDKTPQPMESSNIDPDDSTSQTMSGIESTLVEDMYPKGSSQEEIDRLMSQLKSCLEEAREVCLSSADFCFERNTILKRKLCPPLKRMQTVSSLPRGNLLDNLPPGYGQDLEAGSHLEKNQSPRHRPPLPQYYSDNTSHEAYTGSLWRTHSENELTSSDIESRLLLMEVESDPLTDPSFQDKRNRGSSSSPIQLKKSSGAPLYDRGVSTPSRADPPPFRSHLLSVLDRQTAIESLRSVSGSFLSSTYLSVHSTKETKERPVSDFVTPLGKGLTGNESHQLLEKITTLEEERFSILRENETLREENMNLWTTVDELTHDLDRKHLQLQLLTTDIRQATTEIRLAAEMRLELRDLRRERDKLRDKSSSLEDEGRLVKESLVQRLTEMATTNKVLSLDNQRLRNKLVHMRSATTPTLSPQNSATELKTVSLDMTDFGTEGIIDDSHLQEALLELDDGNTYVHKQGFLIKQGHKVKNWRKRLFVLDTQYLSYYNTEKPLASLPLEDITTVQITQGLTAKPNMFEVHCRGAVNKKDIRIYYFSAPTQEDMHSWIGIIQTLKHTREQSNKSSEHTPHVSPAKQPSQEQPSKVTYNVVKTRSQSSFDGSMGSITMPRLDPGRDSSRQRVTICEQNVTGVRNRMFTETGNRRQDLAVHMDTSDDEYERDIRSPFDNISSDEDVLKGEHFSLASIHKRH